MAITEDLQTPRLDIGSWNRAEIRPTILSQQEQAQLDAVNDLIPIGERVKVVSDAGSWGSWIYFKDQHSNQGTLYVPFGPRNKGLLAVTFEGDLGSLQFAGARGY